MSFIEKFKKFWNSSEEPEQTRQQDLAEEPEQPETEPVTAVEEVAAVTEESSGELADLQDQIRSNLLYHVLSGAILTEEEEQSLVERRLPEGASFYIIIVQSSNELNAAISRELKCEDLGGRLVSMSISETGIFLPGEEAQLQALLNRLEAFCAEFTAGDNSIRCGVSACYTQLENIYTAVRQARNAIPREPGIRRYSEAATPRPLSRRLYEKLFQSVVSLQEEAFEKSFEDIWHQSLLADSRGVFYVVRFMLYSAAEELDIADMLPVPHYDEQLLPGDNVWGLKEYAQHIFLCARERKDKLVTSRKDNVLEFVQSRAFEFDICAALVAEKQGLSERRVYDIVREMTGMTFNDYLKTLRMEKVGQLLIATQMSIWEIAQHCGYQSESTFYRAFKKYYGISPSDYRAGGGKLPEKAGQ